MVSEDKPIIWLRNEIKTPPFSMEARIEAGLLLRRLQNGAVLSLPQSRPMPNIGKGCHELRITDKTKTWRIVFHIGIDAIVILEIFSKKAKETPKYVIDICKKSLKKY